MGCVPSKIESRIQIHGQKMLTSAWQLHHRKNLFDPRAVEQNRLPTMPKHAKFALFSIASEPANSPRFFSIRGGQGRKHVLIGTTSVVPASDSNPPARLARAADPACFPPLRFVEIRLV